MLIYDELIIEVLKNNTANKKNRLSKERIKYYVENMKENLTLDIQNESTQKSFKQSISSKPYFKELDVELSEIFKGIYNKFNSVNKIIINSYCSSRGISIGDGSGLKGLILNFYKTLPDLNVDIFKNPKNIITLIAQLSSDSETKKKELELEELRDKPEFNWKSYAIKFTSVILILIMIIYFSKYYYNNLYNMKPMTYNDDTLLIRAQKYKHYEKPKEYQKKSYEKPKEYQKKSYEKPKDYQKRDYQKRDYQRDSNRDYQKKPYERRNYEKRNYDRNSNREYKKDSYSNRNYDRGGNRGNRGGNRDRNRGR